MSTAADLLPSFRVRFPEFSGETDDRVILYLADALQIFSTCQPATLYLAAHLLALDTDYGPGGQGVDGGMGEIQSESIGPKSVSYKTQAAKESDTFYTTTPYGRRFLMEREACVARKFHVRVY